MIDKKIFTKEYIQLKQQQYKCDPTILERTIFASGLLEALVIAGTEFIFKGGSSLLFLLKKPFRLSTDIDIIVSPKTNIMSFIKKASETYPFVRYEENIRIGTNNIEKKHYRFYYKSITDQSREIPILLDVLFEENHYSKLLTKEIKNDLIETVGNPIYVKVPSPESLLGDKLTAFAPNTIGVKPVSYKQNGKEIDKKIEVIKQFFDVVCLFDIIENFTEVIESYKKTASSELMYRGLDLTFKDCLLDTFKAASSIMSKGKIDSESYKDYLIGIKGISNFLINVNFTAESASISASKVIYLCACILNDEMIKCDFEDQELIEGEYSKLNFIRKIDRYYFNMTAYAILILKNKKYI